MMRNEGFVTVKEAAKILDVAPNTVRAWGAAGTLTEYRHPANNYRLYKQSDVEKLLLAAKIPISRKTTLKHKTSR
ncbi:MerR family regulatory protein [Pirellula sp. SH-Sr6A]|uniref:helix-turn-helix domain-containing protein n=1 Tax=Pirellula sp. SH-Sr6A TaxID=1632865 RepID=UPI00078B8C76|nr:helix-turn-helix domain-containing protein [Pirellula sp. SH-Sr6A]AMV35103.1 MerR family regulatory protein [Pirellula sp. SH-Sr6A]